MEMWRHSARSLWFYQLRGEKQYARSLNDRVTQKSFRCRALLRCTHTRARARVLLCPPSFSERAVCLASAVSLFALWLLHGPVRIQQEQQSLPNISPVPWAFRDKCVTTFRSLLKNKNKKSRGDPFTLEQFNIECVSFSLGVLRRKSGVLCHQLSNQPRVCAHSHPRVAAPRRGVR